MAPVLEDDVDLARVEALPGDLLGERVGLDLVAHLLEQALGDGDVRLGADPLVDHHLDVALVAGARAGRGRGGRARAGRGGARGRGRGRRAGSAALAGAAESPEPLAHPLTTIATIAMPLSQRPILCSRMSVRSSSAPA